MRHYYSNLKSGLRGVGGGRDCIGDDSSLGLSLLASLLSLLASLLSLLALLSLVVESLLSLLSLLHVHVSRDDELENSVGQSGINLSSLNVLR